MLKKLQSKKYENGSVVNIKQDKLKLLADALNTSPSYLMGWDEIYDSKSLREEVKRIENAYMNKEGSIKPYSEVAEPLSLYGSPEKSNIYAKLKTALTSEHQGSIKIPSLGRVTETKKSFRIPILGRVAAGIPIEAIENYYTDEWEEIPEEMAIGADFFALKITGDSMEPKFSEGDVVIVRKQDDLESGEIGVVMIDGCDATVKKVMKQNNGILLVGLNQASFTPAFYDNESIRSLPVKILGKVVELRAKF